MDACQAVDTELDRVLVKFASVKKTSSENIDDSLATLDALKSELITQSQSGGTYAVSPSVQVLLQQSIKSAKDCASRVSVQHKEIHASVSRLGKVIDKNFTQDFNVINCPEAFEGRSKSVKLTQAVVEHLYRNGFLDVGQKLAEEAHLDIAEHQALPFIELNNILNSLEHHDTGPALEWATSHREELKRRGSSLEFKLHRMQFVQLLRKSEDTKQILEYTRNFQYFDSFEQRKEIQKLMGTLLFLRYGLDQSPYRDFINQDLWGSIKETFTKDACALLGLSVESPLTVCVKMGCKAIPMLLQIRGAMMQHNVGDIWNCSKVELPIEIDATSDYLFHSKFACPILRQQSTEKNPPMRLNCGHVISRDALNRLSTSQKTTKIKCPYCPSEQPSSEAKVLYL